MKRVLCIISRMDVGGAETFLMKVYRVLDRSKFQIDFCVKISRKGFYDDDICRLGGKIYHIPYRRNALFEASRALKKIIRENAYDSVLAVTNTGLSLLDLKAAKTAGANRCIARSTNADVGKGILKKILHVGGKLLFLRYVDRKVAPSDAAAIHLFGKKAYEEGEVTILPNGLDLEEYCYNDEARDEIREGFKIPDNAFVVGHIGNFRRQKNHPKLLEIFEKIHEENENAMLLMAGSGEDETKIREQVAEMGLNDLVIFAGTRTDVPKLLSAMDVFVLPSFYEGMPNAVIEAQATGLRCVISDTITREANITGLVQYVPLDAPASTWAEEAIRAGSQSDRPDTKQQLTDAGYEIHEVVKQFTKIVFEDKSID